MAKIKSQPVQRKQESLDEMAIADFEDRAGTAIADLVSVAHGSALLLHGVRETLEGTDLDCVCGGVIAALAAVANRVEGYGYGRLGIALGQDAVPVCHQVRVLEKKVAALKAKAAIGR